MGFFSWMRAHLRFLHDAKSKRLVAVQLPAINGQPMARRLAVTPDDVPYFAAAAKSGNRDRRRTLVSAFIQSRLEPLPFGDDWMPMTARIERLPDDRFNALVTDLSQKLKEATK